MLVNQFHIIFLSCLMFQAVKIAIIAKLVVVNGLFHFVLIFAQLPLQNVLSNTKLP